MKKITLALLTVIALSKPVFSQATFTVTAPQYNGDWAALVGPNGFSSPSVASPTLTYAHNRACYLVTQAELARMALTNSVVTDFGFDIYRPGSAAIPGTFTLYLENTSDVVYSKGTNFATIITGMATHYSSNLTIPAGSQNATTTVNMPLSSSFSYTGGGIYVAYEWLAAAANSTNYVRYMTHNDSPLNQGANAVAPVAGPAPATLTLDVRRPQMRFKAINTATNDISIVSITAPGFVSKLMTPGHPATAIIRNNSINALTSVSVNLSATGANVANHVAVVPNIAAGATANVVFPGYASTASGISTLVVSASTDQFADNDFSIEWQQISGCTDYANHFSTLLASSFSDGAYGYGSQAILATKLTSTGAANVTGIKFASSNQPLNPPTAPTASVCGVLLDAGGTILATTNTLGITAANFGTYLNLKFTPAYSLTAGADYYYGIAQLVPSSYPFATAEVPADWSLNLYHTVNIAGGAIGAPQNHMGYVGMIAVLSFTDTEISASPSRTLVCKQDAANSVTLTAGGGALTTFTWTGGGLTAPQNSAAVLAVSPVVTSTAGGVVVYNVSGTHGPSGCKSASVAITVSVSTCTGLSSNSSNGFDIRLFPNPSVNGKSTITGLVGTNVLTVFNTLGQVVLTQTVSGESTSIDLSGQPSGNYLVKITDTSDNQSRTIKIINQN